jgi:hypothetical protein
MGPLRNQRHERYALAVAEGHSISEGYRLAGYQKNTGNASRLNANESIQARVAELQASAAAKTAVTLEGILGELADAAAVAKDRGQAQALVSAAMARAKLAGLDVQRIEVGTPGDFDNLHSVPAICDRILEKLVEQFKPIDSADREGFIALIERQLEEQEQFLAAIRARPIIAERVDTRNLSKPWSDHKLYSPQTRIGYRNGGKSA